MESVACWPFVSRLPKEEINFLAVSIVSNHGYLGFRFCNPHEFLSVILKKKWHKEYKITEPLFSQLSFELFPSQILK